MKPALLFTANLVLAGVLIWLLFAGEPADDAPDGSAGGHGALGLAAHPTGGDFRLDSAQGTVDLASLRGRVVLVYFGYTACPDICPTNLAILGQALNRLTPEESERVQALFISVDPERDHPERLATYAAYFHPSILGLTGTPAQIAEVARRYGVAYRRAEQTDSAMGYLVDHSASTYVVDPEGRLVRILDHATPAPTILAIIRDLLDPR